MSAALERLLRIRKAVMKTANDGAMPKEFYNLLVVINEALDDLEIDIRHAISEAS